MALSPDVDSTLWQNALRAQAGKKMVWVDGGVVHSPCGDVAGGGGPINGVDVLNLKRVLRREKAWVRALEALGMTREEAVRVISDIIGEDAKQREKNSTAKTDSENSERTLEGRVDASDRQEGGDLILWWNDFEKDNQYSRWSPSFYGVCSLCSSADSTVENMGFFVTAHAPNVPWSIHSC
jgi:UDP-glucose:glycoprotein glucosyltransferase